MKRKLILFIFTIVGCICLLILLIPTILSTEWGKNRLSHALSPDLKIGSLHISWMGPQEMTDISHPEITCVSIHTEASLWSLLVRKDLGHLVIEQPRLTLLSSQAANVSSSQSSKKSSCLSSNSSSWSIPLSGDLKIIKGEVAMEHGVHLSDVAITLHLPREGVAKSSSPITFQMTGTTSQDQVLGTFNLQGCVHLANKEGVLEGNLTHFPIKGVDQMVAFLHPEAAGLITEAIGPSFDAYIHAKIIGEGPALEVTATSDHFQANIQTVAHDGHLVLKNPAQITLHVVPALIQKWGGFTPAKDTAVQISLNQLSIPLKNPLQTALQGTLSISPTQVSPAIAFSGFAMNFTSQDVSQFIKIESESQWQFNAPLTDLFGNSGTFRAEGSLSFAPLSGDFALSLVSERLKTDKLSLAFSHPCSLVTLNHPSTLTYLPPQEKSPLIMTVKEASIPLEKIEEMTMQIEATTLAWKQFEAVELALDIKGWNQIALVAKEKDFFVKTTGGYDAHQITFSRPLILSGLFSNHLFPQNALPVAIRPSPFELQIQPFSLILNQDLLPQLKLQGLGTIENLTFITPEEKKEISLEKVLCKIQIDASQQLARGELSSKGVSLLLSLSDLIFGKHIETTAATLNLDLNLQNFSSALVESWVGSYYPIRASFGPQFDLKLRAISSPEQQNIHLAATSKYFSTELSLEAEEGMLTLKNPGKIDWTITREGFELLSCFFDPKKHFQLEKETHLNGTLSAVKLPIYVNPHPTCLTERFPKIQGSFADMRLQGSASIESLSLSEKITHHTAYLKFLNFTFNKSTAQEPLLLHLDGIATARGSKTPTEGKISLDAKLAHLFSPTGAFDRDAMIADIEASLSQVPTLILDLFNQESKLSKLLGSTLTLNLSTQIQKMSGPLHLSFHAPNTRASLNGNLRNGVLYLAEPIYTQLNLTPSVSQFILGSANPLSISRIYSDTPLSLQIDSAGFALPLFPFNLTEMQIGKARIELGKIWCTNDGTLNFTLGLLKSDRLIDSNELLLWFAPMDLTLSKGVLNIDRTEILVGETFDLALWGSIDLPQDYVDMVLGLTSDALRAAFGIRNLPAEYILQIPLRGPLNNIGVNRSSATAKIATLMIWQNQALQGALRGSGVGALLGGVISKVVPLPDFNKTPPAAKRPFPWEEPQPAQKKTSRKAKHSFNDKPLKQILKLLR